MTMRRRFFLQLGAGALLAPVIKACGKGGDRATTLPASPELLALVQQRGYLRVATEDYYPPFEFLVNDRPNGLDHDLFAQLQQVSPFEMRQEILPWQPILPGVAAGEFDVAITAVVITEERAQSLDFAMPISETTHFYLKRAQDDTLNSVADLATKTLGVQQGGASETLLTGLEQQLGTPLKALRYGSFDAAYRDLEAGRIDAVIHNIVSLSIFVNEKPGLFAVGEAVEPRSYAAWAVRKGNQPLLAYLNAFMAEVRASGELQRLQQIWLKRTFDLPEQPLLPGDRPLPSA